MRAPRRSFAAPLVVTLAALPGCMNTVDHRNPPALPPPTPVTQPAPPTHTGGSWQITMQSDGSCVADADVACEAGMTCNPPPPAPYACPAGITADRPFTVQERGADDCVLVRPMPVCPATMSCNPPPPQKTDCPHY